MKYSNLSTDKLPTSSEDVINSIDRGEKFVWEIIKLVILFFLKIPFIVHH